MEYSRSFRVKPGKKLDLDNLGADFKPDNLDRKEVEQQFGSLTEKLRDLQHLMYAEDKRSHDFLWRYHVAAPRRGMVGIFNRSHYEDVLVVRVHDLVPKKVWSKRYDHINAFEKLLADNGTLVLKFYLHIDREEQLERFKKRIDNPKKNWKISGADYSERPYWGSYTKAFEDAISKCSTDNAPWFVIPANRKWFRNLVIADIVVDAMESLEMKYPEPEVDMEEIRKMYHEAEEAE